ncbi:general substrate transporter [Hyaloscypha variabilis]|uniref:General substrate transporter n=1 Tax=Hyaloscypha variabilis (strain UAMH 11265 / GT02V1 / F) TaxID=1149755 RepID=A0A2J6S1P0_HYAVF|nr:general substrate transporter [Hyaloscypha variabilis F]
MNEKTDPVIGEGHIEQARTNESNVQQFEDGTVEHIAVFSVPLADALAKDKPSPWAGHMWKLYAIMIVVTLNDCMNGYDGSLMSSINAMKPYHDYFNVGMQGGGTGIVFAIYSAGSLSSLPFAASAADRYGRRFGMFIGSFLILIGTIIEASCKQGALGQFMGGRFIIGFGVNIACTSAPTYLVEMAYPSWRGVFGGLYNVVGYYIGAIVCTWTTYGTGHLSTNWSWRIPTIVQCVPSLIVMVSIWFMPESPRWLFTNNKREQGRAVLVKHHGGGDEDSAVVLLECNEIDESINLEIEGSDKRWWDYRGLFNTRGRLYRVFLLMLVSVFSQFIGGSVISYFMPVMLEDIGITGQNQQLLMNALNTVFSFLGGIVGSFMVDRLGRRNLFLWATFLTGLCYIALNIIAWKASATGHVSTGTGYAFIAMIFLYGIFYSFGWTPLQALYPAEILTNEMRAKGMAFQGFMGGVASFINQYATPVALKNIGWKTYTIFLVLHFVQLVVMYLTVVETRGRSIEEIEEIFNDPHPVKRSLQKHEVVVRAGEGVKMEMS